MLEGFKKGQVLHMKYAWPLINGAKDLFAKEETLQASPQKTTIRYPWTWALLGKTIRRVGAIARRLSHDMWFKRRARHSFLWE